MTKTFQIWRRNRTLWITLAILIFLFGAAIRGMETKDWVITLLRGLSVGAITFLVASGFSLIFGLMDVLNMAHGTFFMIGAYVGWTVFVRPDTFIDILPPVLIAGAGVALVPLWNALLPRLKLGIRAAKVWPWLSLPASGVLLVMALPHYPITKWDPGDFANSPVQNAFEASQGILTLKQPLGFEPGVSPFLVIGGILLGSLLLGLSIAGFSKRGQAGVAAGSGEDVGIPLKASLLSLGLLGLGLLIFLFNDPISGIVVALDRNWLFILAGIVAMLTGVLLGAMMEIT